VITFLCIGVVSGPYGLWVLLLLRRFFPYFPCFPSIPPPFPPGLTHLVSIVGFPQNFFVGCFFFFFFFFFFFCLLSLPVPAFQIRYAPPAAFPKFHSPHSDSPARSSQHTIVFSPGPIFPPSLQAAQPLSSLENDPLLPPLPPQLPCSSFPGGHQAFLRFLAPPYNSLSFVIFSSFVFFAPSAGVTFRAKNASSYHAFSPPIQKICRDPAQPIGIFPGRQHPFLSIFGQVSPKSMCFPLPAS